MAATAPRTPEPSMLFDRQEELRGAEAFALFVVIDTPTSIINQVLQANIDKAYGEPYLWLADSESFPEPWPGPAGTVPPVPTDWRSPFLGKTIQECYKYLLEDHYRLPFFVNNYRFVVLDDTLKEDGSLKPMRLEDAGRWISYEEAAWESLLTGSFRKEERGAGPEWYKQALLKGGVAELTIDASDNANV